MSILGEMTAEQVLLLERRWAKLQVARKALAARLALVDPNPPMRRASGDCVCEACDLPYRDHPEHPHMKASFNVLCDGSVVKL